MDDPDIEQMDTQFTAMLERSDAVTVRLAERLRGGAL
jgi:hypothetical protein